VCTGPADPRLLIADLDAPESVVFDPQTESYFVSNLAHDILETDPLHPPTGNVGFISRHDVDGTVIDRGWAEGFASPKGMAVSDGVLFVADPRHIVALDTRTGDELARYTLPEVGLFNDVAVADDGTVYVTDTANPGVYAIDAGSTRMRVVARDSRFEFLNGVAVAGYTVFVASTGILPSESGPGTNGRLFAIDPRSGAVREIENVRGRWDGVAVLDEHHLALDDFMSGAIHLVDLVEETSTKIVEFPAKNGLPFSGVADMGSAGSMLLVPSMFTNEVWTYTPAVVSYE
jgi:outer membrane protein assembly factor BamB